MPRSAYPTADDLLGFLEGAGLTVSDTLQDYLETAAEAGRQAIEHATGRVFLAVTETRSFDPPVSRNGVLDLQADLLSLSGVSYNGSAFTAGTDYRLLPGNRAAGQPYSALSFLRRWASPLPFSLQGSLSLTGVWGYSEQIPDDVWLAMCAAGAAQLVPQISLGLRKGLIRWSEKDRSEQYGTANSELGDRWQAMQNGVIARYKRVAVG